MGGGKGLINALRFKRKFISHFKISEEKKTDRYVELLRLHEMLHIFFYNDDIYYRYKESSKKHDLTSLIADFTEKKKSTSSSKNVLIEIQKFGK